MIPPEAIAMILEAEGLDQPGRWPGGQSGVTIGHGYDLGYVTAGEFSIDWSPHLGAAAMARLRPAIGCRGPIAAALVPSLRDIRVPRSAALAVFSTATLPKWEGITRKTFPGLELLPAAVLGALVSLVFNRGPSLNGERRREMRRIRDAIQAWSQIAPFARRAGQRPLLLSIAAQIRSMKRLWIGKGLDGLLHRREAEARMIETAAVP